MSQLSLRTNRHLLLPTLWREVGSQDLFTLPFVRAGRHDLASLFQNVSLAQDVAAAYGTYLVNSVL